MNSKIVDTSTLNKNGTLQDYCKWWNTQKEELSDFEIKRFNEEYNIKSDANYRLKLVRIDNDKKGCKCEKCVFCDNDCVNDIIDFCSSNHVVFNLNDVATPLDTKCCDNENTCDCEGCDTGTPPQETNGDCDETCANNVERIMEDFGVALGKIKECERFMLLFLQDSELLCTNALFKRIIQTYNIHRNKIWNIVYDYENSTYGFECECKRKFTKNQLPLERESFTIQKLIDECNIIKSMCDEFKQLFSNNTMCIFCDELVRLEEIINANANEISCKITEYQNTNI